MDEHERTVCNVCMALRIYHVSVELVSRICCCVLPQFPLRSCVSWRYCASKCATRFFLFYKSLKQKPNLTEWTALELVFWFNQVLGLVWTGTELNNIFNPNLNILRWNLILICCFYWNAKFNTNKTQISI